MPTIDLRSAPRDARGLVEQGGGYVTSQDQSGNVTYQDAPSFPPTLEQRIWQLCHDAPRGWMTRADIARALGLKKTPWLMTKIEGLVRDGYLVRYQGTWKNGAAQFWYGVPGQS
mgnify:CR=1 FL=1